MPGVAGPVQGDIMLLAVAARCSVTPMKVAPNMSANAATKAIIAHLKEGLSRMRGRAFRLSLRSSDMTPSFACCEANVVVGKLFILQGLNTG